MPDVMQGRSVAAAELVRNFAHWREVGAREPVMITHHGRRTHVFMGVDNFRSMAMGDAAGPSADQVRELTAHIHQGLILCGPDLNIGHINGVALAMTRRWDRQMEGQALFDALPELAGTLTQAHIRHCLTSGETSAADLPSPFRHDCWLHFQACPFAGGVALFLRDISADIRRNRLADVKAAILSAMQVHGGVGYIRVSVRGFIEMADNSFCAMMGLAESRLNHVSLSELVERSARAHFREEMEHVLQGDGDRRIDTRLLTNDGAVLHVHAAVAQLHGTYGSEGAVILVTLADQPSSKPPSM